MATNDLDIPVQLEWDGQIHGFMSLSGEVVDFIKAYPNLYDFVISYDTDDKGQPRLVGVSLVSHHRVVLTTPEGV